MKDLLARLVIQATQRVKDSKRWKQLYIPLIVSVPPVLVAASEKSPHLRELFAAYGWAEFLFLLWPLLLIPGSYIYVWASEYHRVDFEELNRLLQVIDHVVGKKAERFEKSLKQIRRLEDNDPGRIFLTITQPEKQIEEIVAGIHHYYNITNTEPGVTFRVALARMATDFIEDFECFVPADGRPRSSVERLRDERATFTQTARAKKMIIIPSIRDEAKRSNPRFVVTSKELADDEGSMICYPVMDAERDVPYVISVCASEKNYFREAQAKRHEEILNRFANRIRLEHHLRLLKENANARN